MTNPEIYSLSFTTAALLQSESVRMASLYVQFQDWEGVRQQVLEENLLQARTQNTLIRVCREIISRLKTLSDEEIELLSEGSTIDQQLLLWIAICRRYRFIGDFAREVLRERYLSLNLTLSYAEYDSFFNRKAEWHDELEEIASSTHRKLRQMLFKTLREAGLLTENEQVVPAMLSYSLRNVIVQSDSKSLEFLPLLETAMVE